MCVYYGTGEELTVGVRDGKWVLLYSGDYLLFVAPPHASQFAFFFSLQIKRLSIKFMLLSLVAKELTQFVQYTLRISVKQRKCDI
jgi:hypothetical protein